MPGLLIQLSRFLLRTIQNPVDDGRDGWQFRDWPGAECLGVVPLDNTMRSRIGNQWGEWCAEIQLAHCVRSVLCSAFDYLKKRNAHPRAHARVYSTRRGWYLHSVIQVELPLHMCAHKVYLSHPAIRPFFTYLTYTTTRARRVWVSSRYFGVKIFGVAT